MALPASDRNLLTPWEFIPQPHELTEHLIFEVLGDIRIRVSSCDQI